MEDEKKMGGRQWVNEKKELPAAWDPRSDQFTRLYMLYTQVQQDTVLLLHENFQSDLFV